MHAHSCNSSFFSPSWHRKSLKITLDTFFSDVRRQFFLHFQSVNIAWGHSKIFLFLKASSSRREKRKKSCQSIGIANIVCKNKNKTREYYRMEKNRQRHQWVWMLYGLLFVFFSSMRSFFPLDYHCPFQRYICIYIHTHWKLF